MVDPRIRDLLNSSASTKIQDRMIRHAIWLHRLRSGQVRKILNFLNNEVFPDVIEQLLGRLDRIQSVGFDADFRNTDRYKAMASAIRGQIAAATLRLTATLKEDLGEAALMESNFTKKLIQNTVPVKVDYSTPHPNTLRAITSKTVVRGVPFKTLVDGFDRDTRERILAQINIGLAQGESVTRIAQRLRGTRANGFRDGAFQVSRRQAEGIVRTVSTHVTTMARELGYAENPELVKAVKYVATLDSRTTETCMVLDGEVFPVGEGPRPPQHPLCRSTTTPVLASFQELGIDLQELPPGTRATARDVRTGLPGQVPDTLTYREWLRQQPASVQDKILGPGKGRLLRRGTVSFDRFVDKRYRPLTLQELLDLEADILAA